MTSTPKPAPLRFGSWIDHWARRRPDHAAIIFGQETITYRHLARSIDKATRWLDAAGVALGDRVVWLGHNSPRFIELFLACCRLGAVFVPLNSRLTVAEHRHQIDNCRPRLLVAGPTYVEHLRRAAPATRVAPAPGIETPDIADPALLVYTSGTTGAPKGAVHTHQSLGYVVDNGVIGQQLTADDVGLAFLPLFHVGGLNIQVLPLLSVGATVVLQQGFDPSLVLSEIERWRPTISLFVPTTMHAVLEHPSWPETDLSSLRGVMCGSSIVPTRLLEAFMAAGIPTGQVYGSTETGPTSILLGFDEAEHTGSCGHPAQHARVRLGADNEVLVAGPHLFACYWDDEAATDRAFENGWFRTGDVGHQDAGGRYVIDDRLGDLIISGGENVYPAEVELALETAPGVAEIAVLGRIDGRWGQVPVAVVVAEPDARPDLATLRRHGEQHLARFKLPHDLLIVDALPRTALGKVKKHELRVLLEEAGRPQW